MFLGLRSLIYTTRDLEASKQWYSNLLGYGPYFDKPFYVGFDVGGYELGLWPDQPDTYPSGGETYWGVTDIEAAWKQLIDAGCEPSSEVTDVGEGILMAVVVDPAGNRLGIIENAHFKGGK